MDPEVLLKKTRAVYDCYRDALMGLPGVKAVSVEYGRDGQEPYISVIAVSEEQPRLKALLKEWVEDVRIVVGGMGQGALPPKKKGRS